MDACSITICLASALLAHDSFDVREQAAAALVHAPAPIAAVIAITTKDPEVRRRADQVVKQHRLAATELLGPPAESEPIAEPIGPPRAAPRPLR